MGYYVPAVGLFLLGGVAWVVPATWGGWNWMSDRLVWARGVALQFLMCGAFLFYELALDSRALGDWLFQLGFAVAFCGMLALDVFDVRIHRRGLAARLEDGRALPASVREQDVRRWAETHPIRHSV